MKIASKTRKIEKVCTIASEAEMGYGSKMACRRLAETKKAILLYWYGHRKPSWRLAILRFH